MMTNWYPVPNTEPARVHVAYDDGQEFDVLRKDFDRAFGAMVNATAGTVRRDFAVE